MSEQVIRVDGRFIRLTPRNKRLDAMATNCPLVTIKSTGDGFYQSAERGSQESFQARDVTNVPFSNPSINGAK